MEAIFAEYLAVKDQIKLLEEKKLELECKMYEANMELFNSKEEGTFNVDYPGYKLKVVKKETISVDQTMAEVVGMAFRKKYELDKKLYNNLPPSEKKRVDECLTTKSAKPSFTLERTE